MKLIVAVDACWAIGKDGDQLCYIPPDLKRFQRLTTGHPVLLGRKTLATFPGGRPLKNPAADCYFPNLAADPAWEAVETEGPYRYADLAYTYVTYRRR